MGFGGPVWHVSIAPRLHGLSVDTLRGLAYEQLAGVGDPTLGEWTEWTGQAFHLRRRLTESEAPRVGAVKDIRGTWEAQKRVKAVLRYLPDPSFADFDLTPGDAA